MQYFDNLPKIIYTDAYGNQSIRTNLLARASVVNNLLTNPLIYYSYDIQEGDTPEIIAHKYYDDMYRYWIILLCNQILDPQWGWPLNSQQFADYLNDKYGTQNITGTIHHYEQTTTQYDINSQTTTTNTIQIPQSVYNSFVPLNNTYTLPTGPVSVSTVANAINIYQYELQQNESKRSINILNNTYVNEIEKELVDLKIGRAHV